MINYTIIIPHKNLYDLLKRCIDSIPIREDLQIIVVDDNSDDKSRLESVLSERKDIELIITKEGLGAGFARNLGLGRAGGKWLLFADADDYFDIDVLDNVLDTYMGNNDLDAVFLNAKTIDENGRIDSWPINKYLERYKKGKYYAEKMLRYGLWTPWIKMVRRSVVVNNGIRFDETFVANDTMFALRCSENINRFDVVDEIVYYYYTPTSGSITTNRYKRPDVVLQRIEVFLKMHKLNDRVNYIPRRSLLKLLFETKHVDYDRGKRNQLFKQYKYNIFKDTFYLIVSEIFKLIGIK